MDSDPRLVVFFIILSTNPKMLQMMNILVYPGWVTGTGTGQPRRGGQPRRANDIADEPPHRYPRRIRHKAPAPFSSSFRDDSNHPRGRSAVPPPRLSRSRSLPARPSAPEMTDGQLADSTYSEAVAASLLGVQILRSFPGPHYYGQRVPGP